MSDQRPFYIHLPDEDATMLMGQVLAQAAQVGDVFAIVGDLGMGKSTLARAFIRFLTHEREDVPSPTFTLVQTYDHARIPVWHVDAYRISDPSEALELGLEEAFENAISLIEWPDRLADVLPETRTIWIKLDHEGEGRSFRMIPPADRHSRFGSLLRDRQRSLFLAQNGFGDVDLQSIAGDASGRQYFRFQHEGQNHILMDALHQPEVISPFMAASDFMLSCGLSAPMTIAVDQKAALLLSEDLGPIGLRQAAAESPDLVYGDFVEVISHLHAMGPPMDWGHQPGPRTMKERLDEELGRFLSWYVAACRGQKIDAAEQEAFLNLWQDILSLTLSQPQVFSVLDCIHDNLFWLPQRQGIARIGFIDIQDAVLAPRIYDLMSLMWDVRHPVPDQYREKMIQQYARMNNVPLTDIRQEVAIWSVQRNFKILGTFVRLAIQHQKTDYLTFIPMVWHMIDQQLVVSGLDAVRVWLKEVLPVRDLPEEGFYAATS